MRLTAKQQKVLVNTLAWIGPLELSEEDIEQFFAWNDQGIDPKSPGAVELMWGWRSHYGDEYGWIEGYERLGKNPPQAPPQSWIYDAYFSRAGDVWIGWFPLVEDFLRDRIDLPERWRRSKPAYRRAQVMWAYHKGRIGLARFKRLLTEQKS